jgi:signal transduction histidine kinase
MLNRDRVRLDDWVASAPGVACTAYPPIKCETDRRFFQGQAANLLGSMCRSRCIQALLLILTLFIAFPAIAADGPRRIYLLQGLTATQPAAEVTVGAFRARLKEASSEDIEVLTEFLDIGRFPGPEHEKRLVPFLGGKFAQAKPDLIISISRGATSFLVRHRAEIAPGIPILYCCTPTATTENLNIPTDMPGLILANDWTGTFALAERLQPNAKTLVLVSGDSDRGRRWQREAIAGLQPFLNKYDIKYLVGLRYDVLLKEVSRLPRDSIVILVPISDDGLSPSRIGSEVALDVAKASSAPVYSPVVTLLGGGIVGGNMDSLEQQGIKVADFALEILAGKDPSALPHQARLPLQYRVDARQLERWGFSENNLPPGTSVEFKQPSVWELYKRQIIGTLLAIAALIGIIALLLVQMRKRKDAERSLKESEDRMAFAAASTNIGLWRMDIATGRLWATEHCRAMFGIAPETPLTWDLFRAAIHPDDSYAFGEWLEPASRTGLPDSEFRVTLSGHDARWFVCRARIIGNEHGTPLQVSGIFADVTARKSAEADASSRREETAHLLRVAALGELSGGIAHELSQPLASILFNAQAAQSHLLREEHDKQLLAEILEDIVQEGRRAGQVIQRLRRLLKKGEHQSVSIDFNDLVRSTLSLLHAELVHRKIKVDLDLKPGLPPVSGDNVQLQQVLLNLMMNAMEAMDSTAAVLRRLSIATRATPEGYAEVHVSDRGRGIAPEELDRLFQPFFTTKTRGLGLGLPICSTIVTLHRGRISISNADQGGATAVISLPVRVPLAAAS